MVKKYYILIFLLSFVFPLLITAQDIDVFAVTDTTDYLVGDYIYYSLEISYDDDIEVYTTSLKDSIKVLEFISESPMEIGSKNDRTLETYHLIFSKYDSSVVTIPPIPIKYKIKSSGITDVIFTNPVTITVSTLEVNTNSDIQDVKAPIKIELDWIMILIILLILLAIAIIIYYFYRRYKLKRKGILPERKIIMVPPHQEALSSLRKLEEKKLWQQGMIKEYHTEITGIIRKYFEARFKFPALEMYSSQVLDELSGRHGAQGIREVTSDFLYNADMVKFAKFKPLPSVNEEMIKQAYDIVDKTKEIEEQLKVEEEINAG